MSQIPWVIQEQTQLKLDILKKYIAPWATILFKQAKKINCTQKLLYIDGFSGPGVYYKDKSLSETVDGSPIVVARIANNLINEDRERKFNIICIDKDTRCLELLEPKLNSINMYNQFWDIRKNLFENEIYKILNEEKLPPTFCFIDPFGYSIDISVIRDILTNPISEVFVNFMIYDVIRAANNPLMVDILINLFGDNDFMHITDTIPEIKQEKLLSLYCEKLKKYTDVRYVLPFRVNTPGMYSRPRFYLIHLSNNYTALKLMKDRMYNFCTTNFKLEALGKKENDICLFDLFEEIDFKELLLNRIKLINNMTYNEIEEWAYENTCGVSKTIKQKLIELEEEKKIRIDRLPRQRKSTVNGNARISSI